MKTLRITVFWMIIGLATCVIGTLPSLVEQPFTFLVQMMVLVAAGVASLFAIGDIDIND